jgi:hypothetical protein
VIISPMVIWNARHGWPLLAHTVGHLTTGGDQAGQAIKGNPLTWTATTIGGIVGSFGPAAVALMIWASIPRRCGSAMTIHAAGTIAPLADLCGRARAPAFFSSC